MFKKLTNTLIFLVLVNLAGCGDATRLPDFEASVENISQHFYNFHNYVSSKTWVKNLDLPKVKNFLENYDPKGDLNTPIIIMEDENLEDSSFIFTAKTNGKKPTDSNYKIYGLQKLQKNASKNLTGVLMGDKPQNSSDFYTLSNNSLLKLDAQLNATKGDIGDVGVKYGRTSQKRDLEASVGYVSKGAQAEFVLRDPVTTNWNYQTFLYFKQDISASGNKKIGFQSIGQKTSLNSIPKQGLARYVGVVNAFYMDKKSNKKYFIYANIEIWLSFDQKRAIFDINRSFNGTNPRAYEISTGALTPRNLSLIREQVGTIDEISYKYYFNPFSETQVYFMSDGKNKAILDTNTGSINYDFAQNLEIEEILEYGKTHKLKNKFLKNGRIKAQLYGDKAAEIGGVFELHSKEQNIVYMGAFGAKRD